jgi:bifunctional non-homologous end joining protein LigD
MAAARRSPPSSKTSAAAAVDVAGVALSHPDKLYFPEAGISKRDLAEYYVGVSARLLPHLAGRPLSVVRCPDGWTRQCFFQRHADGGAGPAVTRLHVPAKEGSAVCPSAGSAAALAALVQWGVVELHPWSSRTPRFDRPDRLIFDLDPDEAIGWEEVVAAVTRLRDLLAQMKLVGFLKTTGGKGLHVVLPIRATLTWDDAKAFTRGVARTLSREFPDRYTASAAKARRSGKVFIDYLRNAAGATAIAPYSVRARANAPVSTPIGWDELAADVRFSHFNLRNLAQHLATQRTDPWDGFAATRQTITAAHLERAR